MNSDIERRNILIISAVILAAFVAACYSLGAAQIINPHEITPAATNAPTGHLAPEWSLSREGATARPDTGIWSNR